jgi:hypothetical protein
VNSALPSAGDAPEAASPRPAAPALPSLPRWVTVSDVIATLAMAVAVAVAVGGGFRIRTGALRLSVTSPLGPLLVCLFVLGARHAFHRRPHLLECYRARLSAGLNSESWRAAWPVFIATRAGILVVGLLAVYTIGYATAEAPIRKSDSEILNLPMRWDAGWYYSIARIGYYWDRRQTGQQNIAFFPAYPMMTRTVARLFGGSETAFVMAGVAVSHAAFLWALLLLHQLARDTLEDPDAARYTVVLAACYPFSVFYGAMYTESLFLLGAVGAVLEFRRARWQRSVAWGVLVGLTRPNGFLLAAPLAVMAVEAWRRRRLSSPQSAARCLAAVVAPVAGTAIFSLYIWTLTGNPLAWADQQQAWGRTFTGAAPLLASADDVFRNGAERFLAARPYDAINGAAAILVAALVIPVGLRLGLAYAVLLVVNLVPPLLLGGTMSVGRITSTMFPVFLWFASATPRWRFGVAVVFALFQGFAGALFYTWRPLF